MDFIIKPRAEYEVDDKLKALRGKIDTLTPEEYSLFQSMLTEDGISPERLALLESCIYKTRPPTPEEFLDWREGWLPKDFCDSIREWVRDSFYNISDPKLRYNNNKYNTVCFYGATRCEAKGTKILMWDMTVKNIEDVVVGDLLMGDDSKPRTVLSLHKGHGKLYKVKQNKSDDYVVNEDHILVLQYTNKGLRKDRNNAPDKNANKTIEISVKDYLKLSKNKKHLLKGLTAKLDFEEREVKIDPYILGSWLGDGTSRHTQITNIDCEVIDYWKSYSESIGLGFKQLQDGREIHYNVFSEDGYQFNTLRTSLVEYDLLKNKHIPLDYLKNSRRIRLELLAGLLDSDGYLSISERNGVKTYSYEITQKSEQLIKDIDLLCRSLGLRSVIRKKKGKIASRNFEGDYFRIHINGNVSQIPIKIARKKIPIQDIRETKVNSLRTGISIEPYGEGDFYGFELDGNHRYLHSDLTITHNTGKSFWAVLQMLYTIVYLAHLRDVRGYYKLAPNTVLSMFILSFDLAKVKEVYLEPLYNLMLQSERFEKVQFQDTVADRQHKAGMDKIIYSKATNVGHITLASGLKLVSGNDDVLKIIGSNILSAYISEIAFFIESAGASEESIFRIYSDVSERIKATMGRKAYLSFTYLDSSANISDSQIESHILKEIRYKDNAYFKWFKRWDVVETHDKYFPIWKETGETFPVCVGDGKNPARILQPHEVKTVPADLVEWVPIDSKEEMLINPLKTIKDVIGRPTVKESKFIQDPLLIDHIFDTNITNIESSIMADTDSMPELLIWSQFPVDKYFRKLSNGDLAIKRSPNEPRFLGFDLAKSSKGDVIGISMCHWEWSREQEAKILVYDFSFAITPGENGINLKAVTEFVLDLIRLGNVGIIGGNVDTALSDELQQNLNREIKREHNKFIEANSVDRSPNDYQSLLSLMFNNRVKVGRNIFLKNNLNCLERVFDNKGREKIDHPKGDTFNVYDGLWETSKVGRNAKDVSDSMAQACSFALTKKIDVSSAIYEEQNELFGEAPVKTVDKRKLASAFKLVLPNVAR